MNKNHINIIKPFRNYLELLFQEASKYGKKALIPHGFKDIKSCIFIIGFEAPNGFVYGCNLKDIKKHFETKEWREDKPIILPSGTKVNTMTRLPVDIIDQFKSIIAKALDDGDKIYNKLNKI